MMNKILNKDQNMLIEDRESEKSLSGTITLSFKFGKCFQLQYDQNSCCINDHNTFDYGAELQITPIDLNVQYSFPIEQNVESQLDVEDYYLDDISDFDDEDKSEDNGQSYFNVQYFAVSPNNQFIIICISVSILTKKETQRLIIIDMKNQHIKKVFYRTCFMVCLKPKFSKDSKFAMINIKKNFKGSRFLFLNLKDGIQEEVIINFKQNIKEIYYDESSGCIFYISVKGNIYQVPFNLEDFTIDKSNQKIYKSNLQLPDYDNFHISLYLLYDYLAVISQELGQFTVIRIGNNCKPLKTYIYSECLVPQYTFNKAFVVMSDFGKKNMILMDISRGRLIRKKKSNLFNGYTYFQNGSYFLSIVSYPSDEEDDDNQESPIEQKIKWKIFDFIRGTEIELKRTKLTEKEVYMEIFTRNIVIQNYENKISYQLKL